MKQLYDPHMFDYTWESVDHNEYVVGTYYIEDVVEDSDFIDHFGQVQRLALEGSTSSWQNVSEETPEMREKLTSKVLGYFEIPAPKGTQKAVVQLGFPTARGRDNVPMMLLSIAGNCFAYSKNIMLTDLFIGKNLLKKFKGPKFGVDGIRKLTGVQERPLSLHIIKPKMGMTPEQTANQVRQTALGGADMCKDDEMLGDAYNNTMEQRLPLVMEAINERAQKDRQEDDLPVQHHRRADAMLDKAAARSIWAPTACW